MRFGRAGRTEKEKVLARHEPDAQQIDDFFLADECRFHRGEDFRGKAAAKVEVVGGHFEWFGVGMQLSLSFYSPGACFTASSTRGSLRRGESLRVMILSR